MNMLATDKVTVSNKAEKNLEQSYVGLIYVTVLAFVKNEILRECVY